MNALSAQLRSYLLYLVIALLPFTPRAIADGLPNLGENSQAVLTPQQERRLGEEIMQEIRQDRTFYDDPEVTEYLNDIGYRLVANSADSSLHFEFFAIRDNTLNAFALPGGFIGVHTGLILSAQSESELASVLAHEIAHVTQHHIARMVAHQQQSTLPTLAALAVAILAARTNPQISEGALAAAQAGAVQSQLNFTRENEEEADRIGLQTLTRSHFDPRAMESFFERLQKFGRLYDNNAPAYLRTHPVTSDRIAEIENRVSALPYRQVPDSLDFQLIRAKLRADLNTPQEAVKEFNTSLAEKKYNNETAQRYGLARALMQLGQLSQAEQILMQLRKLKPDSAIIETQWAELASAENNKAEAVKRYRAAQQLYPGHHALAYGYATALLQNGQTGDALKFLSDRLQLYKDDYHLYELQAKAYAALGNGLLSHQAQAEAYVRLGNLSAAIDQLQIALKQGKGNFYQLSIAEARLRELRAQNSAAHKKQKGP
ncbi:MAG: M48 family metalloprotease [Sulfuricellaceae bacterium]|nr:M48 family metalloprotease [Sulfuricellaceae bacterium]